MFADYHVHTHFSDDSSYFMEKVIQDSINMGMDEICITDHVDYGIKNDYEDEVPTIFRYGTPLLNVDYETYYKEIQRLRRVYPQFPIKLGLEFGIQRHTIENYNKLFNRYPFDFILLSIHQVNNKEFWNNDFQNESENYIKEYYEELLYVVKHYKNYSVLAHMDMITRYDIKNIYSFEEVKPIIIEILKQVINDGKGIEFNTSYHRYKLNDTTPSIEILKLYKELGGTIITIGSDSHKEEHLGAYYNEAIHTLKQLGFKSICTFNKMKPIYHNI